MKKLILLLALIAISHSIIYSQGCLPEGITFTTQEQIDNFQTNYPGCTEIEGDVTITGDITNLFGLNVLTSIGGYLHLWSSHILPSLVGLDSLSSIGGSFQIMFNDELIDLTGLNALNYIGDDLKIRYNDNLLNLNGLQSLSNNSIHGIYITDNSSLLNLQGLNGLTSILGGMEIFGNESLIDLSGLNNLSSIANYLEITFNSALTNLTGLESLNYLGGELRIAYNVSLASLIGLNSLSTIEGLTIDNNNNLTTLDALNTLSTVIGMKISFNNSLKSLSGLDNIEPNTLNQIKITYNDSLSDCDIKNICEFLLSPFGIKEIHDNAPGCNSQEEVEAACFTSIEDNIAKEGITLFPNPATSFITINVNEGLPIEEAIIYNHLGQKALVAVPVNNTVDVSGLTPGIYFIEVITSESRAGTKLVVEKWEGF
jgi:hypothetical protein